MNEVTYKAVVFRPEREHYASNRFDTLEEAEAWAQKRMDDNLPPKPVKYEIYRITCQLIAGVVKMKN